MKKVTHLSKAVQLMLKGMALFIGLCFASAGTASAQGSVTCPPNVDWSFGNFTHGICYAGTASTGTTFTTMARVSHRPRLLPVDGISCLVQVMIRWEVSLRSPQVEGQSVRLGDTSAGSKAERIKYYVHVPVGFNDYSFNY